MYMNTFPYIIGGSLKIKMADGGIQTTIFIEFIRLVILVVNFILSLGGSLKIKMADGGIQRNIFIVKHDGSIDF